MKKILLSLMFVCAIVLVQAQVVCSPAPIKRWDGSGTPGDMGVGRAGTPLNLFTIDGSSVEWIQHITGAYNYAGAPKGGYEPNPHLAPVAGGNVQFDGLKAAIGADYDRDVPGQDHRDLRYFAFTYDQANVYFYFRRPKNNTAQVSLYYFIDINVDGFMKTGEPVIKITFNNSGSNKEMGFYQAVNSNATAAGSYDAVKGNVMSATTTRVKNIPNTSEWAVGSADGWNMPGNFVSLGNGVNLPALQVTNGIQEIYAASTLTDTHPDGNEPGYGVEFAVPFRYIGMYTAAGLTGGTAINYSKIFTWHVSLGSGNSGVSGAEDNAGGCCSGLAVSGTPSIDSSATFSPIAAPFMYRLSISYIEEKNVNTLVSTSRITVVNPKDNNGADIPKEKVIAWVITANINEDCNVNTVEATETFDPPTDFVLVEDLPGNPGTFRREYYFVNPNPAPPTVTAEALGTSCIYFDIDMTPGGFPFFKSANMRFTYNYSFDLQSNDCTPLQSAGNSGNIETLPVKLISFNAARNNQNVNLSWQTATEDNSKGFDIEKSIGAGGWQKIGFVASQAVNGTSNSSLSYQFTDFNNTTKGITQYRLKQVDIDNRGAYSAIRSVRGIGQKGKTIVFPNPSSDGKVNVVFEDVNVVRDVTLIDMNGRSIRQWKGITSNNIQIENLSTGFYSVRIVNNETGEQVVEKIVVNKR